MFTSGDSLTFIVRLRWRGICIFTKVENYRLTGIYFLQILTIFRKFIDFSIKAEVECFLMGFEPKQNVRSNNSLST